MIFIVNNKTLSYSRDRYV